MKNVSNSIGDISLALKKIGVNATKLVGATSIVVLAACGGGDQVDATTPVTPVTAPVTPVNHAPTFASSNTSSSVTLMSEPVSVPLHRATDADSGDTLTHIVSNLPTGVTYDPTAHSISISPTTTPNTYTIIIAATDNKGAIATMTVSLDISLAIPTGPVLADVGPLLDRGGNPIKFSLNALAGLPAGSQIIGVTGFPTVDDFGVATNLTYDISGNGTMSYDIGGSGNNPRNAIGFKIALPIIVEVKVPGFQIPLKRSQNIIVENEA